MATVTGAYGSGNVNIGVTAGNVFRPNVWSNEVLMFVKANLVLLPLVRHYDAEVQAYGQAVNIPNVSTITANAKAQNTLVTLNYNIETQTTITINQHYESSFLLEDIEKIQSKYDLNIRGSLYRKVVNKLCKLQETLSETICSQALSFA